MQPLFTEQALHSTQKKDTEVQWVPAKIKTLSGIHMIPEEGTNVTLCHIALLFYSTIQTAEWIPPL